MSPPPPPLSSEDDPSLDPEDVERPGASVTGRAVMDEDRAGHDPYLAFRTPSYAVLTAGWMVALIGHAIESTALGWEIYDRTGSELQLGYVAGVQAIPLLLLALPAGQLADLFDRRKIIFISQITAAVFTAWLAWLSYSPTWGVGWMYVALVLSSTALVLGRPSRSALMPMLVAPAAFANAVAWNSTMFRIATVIGPALGGLVIALSLKWHGTLSMAYGISAGCMAGFAVMMPLLKLRPMLIDNRPPDRSLLAGLRFVWNTKVILAAMSLDMFAVLLGGSVYLLPVFAKDILHVGSVGFGWLRSAEAVGALVMALMLAHLPPMKHAGRAILLSVAGFGLATIVFGLSTNFVLSFAMLVLIGVFDSISVVIRHTLVQVMTPDAMRGRVSAVNNVFIGASNELGGLESGVTAKLLGPVGSVVLGGFGTIVIVAAVAAAFPNIRRLKGLQEAGDI